MVEVALRKLLGGRVGLHDPLRLPRLLTTITRQLDILVTTLNSVNSLFKRNFWFVVIQKFCYHGNVT